MDFSPKKHAFHRKRKKQNTYHHDYHILKQIKT